MAAPRATVATGQMGPGQRPQGPGRQAAMLAGAPTTSAPGERPQLIDTDKAAGIIVVGCILFLAGLRVAFKGHVV